MSENKKFLHKIISDNSGTSTCLGFLCQSSCFMSPLDFDWQGCIPLHIEKHLNIYWHITPVPLCTFPLKGRCGWLTWLVILEDGNGLGLLIFFITPLFPYFSLQDVSALGEPESWSTFCHVVNLAIKFSAPYVTDSVWLLHAGKQWKSSCC